MGIFDSLYIACPNCGEPMEFQSKALDDAYLRRFTLQDCPPEILCDVMNDPRYHEKCGQWVALIDPNYPPGEKPRPSLQIRKVIAPENPQTHFQGFKWWPEGRAFTYADLETAAVSAGNRGV